MQYRSWELRSVDRTAAAKLAKYLAEDALEIELAQREEEPSEQEQAAMLAQKTKTILKFNKKDGNYNHPFSFN